MGSHPAFRAYLALLAVYLFWGTTYVAIRIALESFPPLILLTSRFLLSGSIMMLVAWMSGAKLPRGPQLSRTALFGVITLGGGNGALIFAEQWILSGLAALFITTSPFWMVGLEAALPGGPRLHLPTLGGILVGFAGVLLLVGPAAFGHTVETSVVQGFFVLQFGCLCWCLGSLLQRRQTERAHPFVSGAIQQMATGLAFLPVTLLVREHPIYSKPSTLWALGYLVIFGSIIGYTSFVYAMEHLPVAIVSTYTYVNPLVAVFLGWLFYREPFGLREALAMLAVFTGVALVKYWSSRSPSARSLAKVS